MNFIFNPANASSAWQRKCQLAGIFVGACFIVSNSVLAQTNPPPILDKNVYQPDNVFVVSEKLSAKTLRVAILPLASQNNHGNLPEGCETLTPIVLDQFVKTKRFEAITIDADKLRAATGRATWTGLEILPNNFMAYLQREYACDAVLFGEVTQFRAYAPLAIGWRFKLVDVRTGKVIWAVDETFDASNVKVAKAAQRFEHPKPLIPFLESGDWAVLNSPRRFGNYSVAALLATLPER